MAQFENNTDSNRQQILMLITDGDPCLPTSEGGCHFSGIETLSDFDSQTIYVLSHYTDPLNFIYSL